MRPRTFAVLRKIVKGVVWLGLLLALGYFVAKRTILYVPEVRVARAGRRDVVAEVFGRGTLEAKILVDVGSKIVGKIECLHADQGDRVKAEQLLARLEKKDLAAKVLFQRLNQDEVLLNRGGLASVNKAWGRATCDPAPVVDYEGNALLCCNDYLSTVKFGNILDRSFREIWRQPAFRRLRARLLRGKFDLPMCRFQAGLYYSAPSMRPRLFQE